MSLNATVSWSPPPIQALNYSNCTAGSAFLASSVNLNVTQDIGYSATFNFLRSLVPSNWTDNNPSDGELLVWLESWSNDTITEVFDTTYDTIASQCDREICPFLQLEGDPDLAGIGMMASYYLIAFLATVYPVVIGLNSFPRFKASQSWKTFHSWFEQTLNAFLDASLLFSISMLLAAIYRFSSASRNPDGDDNTFIYSLINAVTVSMFSVFPPLMLQFTARNLRRRGIRALLWFLVIAFTISMTILYYIWRGPDAILSFFKDETHQNEQINRHLGKAVWLIFCDMTDGSLIQSLDRAIITAQVVLALNLPCWGYLVYTIGDAQQDLATPQDPANDGLHDARSKFLRRYEKLARALNILLCCVVMWLLLGTFTTIAVRLADAMRPWGKDRRWSIGQVLALATFVPLLIDLGAIAMDEPRRALEGKLPRSMRIVGADEPAQATNANDSRDFAFDKKQRPDEYDEYEMLEDGARRSRV